MSQDNQRVIMFDFGDFGPNLGQFWGQMEAWWGRGQMGFKSPQIFFGEFL